MGANGKQQHQSQPQQGMRGLGNPIARPGKGPETIQMVVNAAKELNQALAGGARRFAIPIGLASDIARLTAEAGWTAVAKVEKDDRSGNATIWVACDQDPKAWRETVAKIVDEARKDEWAAGQTSEDV